MELAVIILKQVIILFFLIFSGALCYRLGAWKPEAKKAFSDLLLYLVVPVMVVNSYLVEFDPSTTRKLLHSFLWSGAALLLGLAVTYALTWKQQHNNLPIQRFACIFSNAAYMGFPLIQALFGTEGLLYASAFVTMFNILLWTVGCAMLSGNIQGKAIAASILKTPVIYAVILGMCLYFLQVPVPELIKKPCELISNMNTPLSMIITGMLMAASNIGRILKSGRLWQAVIMKMLVIPAVCVAVFSLLGWNGIVAEVVLVLEACPSAAITSVFAVQYHHDEEFAAGLVVVTTLISIVTLPLCALLLTTIM
ncbi:MAG: AEC family transporter [Brotaphodocola sp.]